MTSLSPAAAGGARVSLSAYKATPPPKGGGVMRNWFAKSPGAGCARNPFRNALFHKSLFYYIITVRPSQVGKGVFLAQHDGGKKLPIWTEPCGLRGGRNLPELCFVGLEALTKGTKQPIIQEEFQGIMWRKEEKKKKNKHRGSLSRLPGKKGECMIDKIRH